jgi:integrase
MSRRRYQQPSIQKTRSKRPAWYFRVRVDTLTSHEGVRALTRPEKRCYVGFCDEVTKVEAKKKRDEILSECINKPQVLIPSQVKFAEVLKVYQKDHLDAQRGTTKVTQESVIRKHIEPAFGKLRMCDVDVLTVQRWLSQMDGAYSSKDGRLTVLKLIWAKAQEWGFATSPFPKAKYQLGTPREIKGRDLPTFDQIRRFMSALDDPHRATAELELYTGWRWSEVYGLQWPDVGPQSVVMQRRVSQLGDTDTTKNCRIRVADVRCISAVLDRLRGLDSLWVIPRVGTGYDNYRLNVQIAAKVAGIRIARFGDHHLRAVFNTVLRSSGADAHDRLAMMGHADERTNRLYVLADGDEVRRRGDLALQVQVAIMGDTKGVQ